MLAAYREVNDRNVFIRTEVTNWGLFLNYRGAIAHVVCGVSGHREALSPYYDELKAIHLPCSRERESGHHAV